MITQVGVNRNLWATRQSGLLAPKQMNFSIDRLQLYLPLWHPELSGTTIISKDLNAHSCTVTGAIHNPPTHRFFDGNDDKIVVPNHASLAGMTSFTVEVWMKSDGDAGALNGLIGKYDTAKKEWFTSLDDDLSAIGFRVYDDSADTYIGRKDTISNVWDDAPHHIVYAWSGAAASSGVKIYVDGVKTDDTDDENGIFVGIETKTANVEIGTRLTGVGFYKNDIGEVRIYSRELSLEEIKRNRLGTIYNTIGW